MLGTVVIAIVILAAVLAGAFAIQKVLANREVARVGSADAAQSDEKSAVPSILLLPDDSTPLGDTPDAHDEITPHDLPLAHPGRQAAEDQAGEHDDSGGGTTRGHEDPTEAPPDGARS